MPTPLREGSTRGNIKPYAGHNGPPTFPKPPPPPPPPPSARSRAMGCIYLTAEEVEVMRNLITSAISDFRWAENAVPGTNFQASILGLENVLNTLK